MNHIIRVKSIPPPAGALAPGKYYGRVCGLQVTLVSSFEGQGKGAFI